MASEKLRTVQGNSSVTLLLRGAAVLAPDRLTSRTGERRRVGVDVSSSSRRLPPARRRFNCRCSRPTGMPASFFPAPALPPRRPRCTGGEAAPPTISRRPRSRVPAGRAGLRLGRLFAGLAALALGLADVVDQGLGAAAVGRLDGVDRQPQVGLLRFDFRLGRRLRLRNLRHRGQLDGGRLRCRRLRWRRRIALGFFLLAAIGQHRHAFRRRTARGDVVFATNRLGIRRAGAPAREASSPSPCPTDCRRSNTL